MGGNSCGFTPSHMTWAGGRNLCRTPFIHTHTHTHFRPSSVSLNVKLHTHRLVQPLLFKGVTILHCWNCSLFVSDTLRLMCPTVMKFHRQKSLSLLSVLLYSCCVLVSPQRLSAAGLNILSYHPCLKDVTFDSTIRGPVCLQLWWLKISLHSRVHFW